VVVGKLLAGTAAAVAHGARVLSMGPLLFNEVAAAEELVLRADDDVEEEEAEEEEEAHVAGKREPNLKC
jgi:hypothetical protein